MPPDDGNAVEPLINRIHLQVQERVCVRADQPLACVRRLLASASEQQSGDGLAHARFHTLIRRILPTALQGDFHAGGIVLRSQATGGEKTLLPQFRGLYGKRKNQIPGHPLKWLEVFRIIDETKRHKCANCHGAASFDEASSICEHYAVPSTASQTSPARTRSWACHNSRYYSRFKGRSCEVHKRVWLDPVPAFGHGGRRGAGRIAVSHRCLTR
jgi:hypothetical protein